MEDLLADASVPYVPPCGALRCGGYQPLLDHSANDRRRSRQPDAKPETGKGEEPIEGLESDALGQGHETAGLDEGAHASKVIIVVARRPPWEESTNMADQKSLALAVPRLLRRIDQGSC